MENSDHRTVHTIYYLPKVEIKNCNVKIDGGNLFDQPTNHNIEIYENIRKIATGQGDNYITECLLDCPSFKENYKLIVTDLRKQQAVDADPRPIQQINFTRNFDRSEDAFIIFILEEAKQTVLDFSQGTVRVL